MLNKNEKNSIDKLKEGEEILKKVFSEIPNYDLIVKEILKNGISKELSEKCSLTVGFSKKYLI
jgi:hypothetical protein